MIQVSAFKSVPPAARGLVRDLRVRWALEEAGLPYEARLLALGEHKKPAYRSLQPFGQVPIFQEDGVVLFESGAIVLHIGERSPALLPAEPEARAQVVTWMFAALNTVEPALGAGAACAAGCCAAGCCAACCWANSWAACCCAWCSFMRGIS